MVHSSRRIQDYELPMVKLLVRLLIRNSARIFSLGVVV